MKKIVKSPSIKIQRANRKNKSSVDLYGHTTPLSLCPELSTDLTDNFNPRKHRQCRIGRSPDL